MGSLSETPESVPRLSLSYVSYVNFMFMELTCGIHAVICVSRGLCVCGYDTYTLGLWQHSLSYHRGLALIVVHSHILTDFLSLGIRKNGMEGWRQ